MARRPESRNAAFGTDKNSHVPGQSVLVPTGPTRPHSSHLGAGDSVRPLHMAFSFLIFIRGRGAYNHSAKKKNSLDFETLADSRFACSLSFKELNNVSIDQPTTITTTKKLGFHQWEGSHTPCGLWREGQPPNLPPFNWTPLFPDTLFAFSKSQGLPPRCLLVGLASLSCWHQQS